MMCISHYNSIGNGKEYEAKLQINNQRLLLLLMSFLDYTTL